MADRHAAGLLVLGVARYVAESLPLAECERVRASAPAVIQALPQIQPHGWYPLSYVIDLCRAIDELYPDPEASFAAIRRAGQSIADDAATTFMRLVIKVVTPSMFVRQFPTLWKKYHDFGEAHVDWRDVQRACVSIDIPGYEYVIGLATGWIDFAFEKLGKKVSVSSNYVWRSPVPDRIVVRIDWAD